MPVSRLWAFEGRSTVGFRLGGCLRKANGGRARAGDSIGSTRIFTPAISTTIVAFLIRVSFKVKPGKKRRSIYL